MRAMQGMLLVWAGRPFDSGVCAELWRCQNAGMCRPRSFSRSTRSQQDLLRAPSPWSRYAPRGLGNRRSSPRRETPRRWRRSGWRSRETWPAWDALNSLPSIPSRASSRARACFAPRISPAMQASLPVSSPGTLTCPSGASPAPSWRLGLGARLTDGLHRLTPPVVLWYH